MSYPQPLDSVSALQALCKATGKYGMLINFDSAGPEDFQGSWWDELFKAAPYLKEWFDGSWGQGSIEPLYKDGGQVLSDGFAMMLMDTEEEMWQMYYLTVGDDGPTETNSYSGPAKIYALTINSNGQLGTENT